MANRIINCTGYAGRILFLFLIYIKATQSQNVTTEASYNGTETVVENSEIDFETLSMFGVTPEFAEQFRLNLIKAIEAAKEQDAEPLRQGEFGGVNGGFYQGQGGGGGAGAGGGGGGQEEEDDYEEDEMTATTPGPGPFGVLSGLFGIFSGLGTLNPSRIIQSTVNFFPPGQRMMAQMIVDSLIGYTPPENRTARPRPRPRRTTTVLPLTEMMISNNEVMPEMPTATQAALAANETAPIVAKDGESNNGTNVTVDAMSEVISPPESTTTPLPDFINVHELLNRTTAPPPPTNEDDEGDVEKRLTTTEKLASNSSLSSYKIRGKSPDEDALPENSTIIPPTPIPPIA